MNLGIEDEFTEFKESLAQLDKGLKSVTAMLNKHGEANVYFGVSDNGDVIGMDIGKDTLMNIRNRIRDRVEPRIYADIKDYDARNSAFADAVRVFACTRVDADDVAFVHEQRDGDFIAVFDLGGLRYVRGRVAARTGLRLHDLLFDEERQRDFNRLVAEEENRAFHVVVKEIFVLADDRFRNADVFERLLILEDVEIAFFIHVDQILFGQVGLADLVDRTERTVRRAAGNHVFQLATIQSLSLSRLAKIEFRDNVRVAIHFDFQTLA